MRFATTVVLGMSVILLVSGISGCTNTANSQTLALQARLTTDTPPAGEVSVSSVRKLLKADDAPESTDVVVRGRLNAGESPPWQPGEASFVLTDATGHDGDDDHDPHTCPFCSRSIKDYLAKVMFLDESGKPLTVDTRELFSVKENQLVIVSGKASLNEDDMLVIEGTSIYIKR